MRETSLDLKGNNIDSNSCPGQEKEVTSTPKRLVDNVVLTTKGLQERNKQILDRKTVENKGKTIHLIQLITLSSIVAWK